MPLSVLPPPGVVIIPGRAPIAGRSSAPSAPLPRRPPPVYRPPMVRPLQPLPVARVTAPAAPPPPRPEVIALPPPVLVYRLPAPPPLPVMRVVPAPAPKAAAKAAPKAVEATGGATSVTIVPASGMLLTCFPADLTHGPRADISEFTIVTMDAGTF